MHDDADLALALDDPAVLRRERVAHRRERLGEPGLGEVVVDLTVRSALHEPRPVEADALDLPARLARLVPRVEEAVLEGRRAAVDHEDLLRSLTDELEAVRIRAREQ